jgi:hypothetical protein
MLESWDLWFPTRARPGSPLPAAGSTTRRPGTGCWSTPTTQLEVVARDQDGTPSPRAAGKPAAEALVVGATGYQHGHCRLGAPELVDLVQGGLEGLGGIPIG